jgi:hypothetical protein
MRALGERHVPKQPVTESVGPTGKSAHDFAESDFGFAGAFFGAGFFEASVFVASGKREFLADLQVALVHVGIHRGDLRGRARRSEFALRDARQRVSRLHGVDAGLRGLDRPRFRLTRLRRLPSTVGALRDLVVTHDHRLRRRRRERRRGRHAGGGRRPGRGRSGNALFRAENRDAEKDADEAEHHADCDLFGIHHALPPHWRGDGDPL